ncbi:MAG TPA: CDP-alcohol phosphatidyltransferase family protein [Stellaceae bacterium]|jgi:cardiolipin synthase|nr:CDP-alcohol phosphatidyltransferase family protein [Stellaceae bacterium]
MVPEITPSPEMSASQAMRRRTIPDAALNLPNLITLARLFSVPFVIWLIAGERYVAAFGLFCGAGISDALDGYIAKRFNRRTRLGAVLDPAADKALLVGVYISLGLAGQLPNWLVALVILRDLLIVFGFVLMLTTESDRHFGPLYISKVNTLVQILLVGFVLARLGLGIEAGLATALLIIATAATTALSGVIYLRRWSRIWSASEPAL